MPANRLTIPVVAVVGPPNSGKTTLFNWLTNSKYKTVNYPGATVEYSIAELAPHFGAGLLVMDTPGTYSLMPKSEDEEVTLKALYQHPEFGTIQKVLAVVDATQLARHLVLVQQLVESGFQVVVALTMSDLIRKSEQRIDIETLSQRLGCKVIAVDGVLGGGLTELIEALKSLPKEDESVDIKKGDWSSSRRLEMIAEADRLASVVSLGENKNRNLQLLERTRLLDHWLLHPIWGILIFIVIMSGLFTAIFALATPFMDFIDSFFSGLSTAVAAMGSDNLFADFIGNGVITSFGAVLVFVPQIFILFSLIGYLESTGYLARAATLIDRPLAALGMSGRSFVPILSGFACAVPALMASRNISSRRDRLITMMIIPLMTCSARLPVYALLLAFLFRGRPAWQAGLGLAGLYLGAMVVGAMVSGFLNRFLPREKKGFFMMELPLYRRPLMGVVLHHAATKTYGYIRRAGPPIFIFALLIWGATTFPHHEIDDPQRQLESSYAGQLGQQIEPIFKPMGADWRVGVGLLSAFAAREVFASSLAVIFNVTANNDDGLQEGLLQSMSLATHADGSPLFTPASVLALLIFVMVALQCTSTTAMMIRESGNLGWALAQLAVYNILAYLLAVGVFQLWS